MKKIYVDRSRAQSYRRCPRQRFLEYSAGSAKVGLVPKRKSIHLVIGLAVHAGLEELLGSAMDEMADGGTVESVMQHLPTWEQASVNAAIEELNKSLEFGVELDTIEQPDPTKPQLDPTAGAQPIQSAYQSGESPLVLDFDLGVIPDASPPSPSHPSTAIDFSAPVYASSHSPSATLDLSDEETSALNQEISSAANAARDAGVDDYLKKELVSLVEGMVRAYARRRLKPLLEEFEVLEVEREGSWKLGDVPQKSEWSYAPPELDSIFGWQGSMQLRVVDEPTEIHWMSRHDALLLHRSTSYLYLLSFKTTGSWDRRKKQDAEIDMQGLSEAVDVENRMAEAWEIIQKNMASDPSGIRYWIAGANERFFEDLFSIVSERIVEFLISQPAPPKIHAVRYEYLLKGSRREEKESIPKRYVQDSPLIRAYRQDGITLSDRRWAANYKWFDLTGKGHTLPYRSWKKSNIWETIPISEWIDLLDSAEIQPDTYDEAGRPVDVLADQFIEPIIVHRNSDDMRDWLEQVEAQEIQVALDVEKVYAAKDEGEKRSLLNQFFCQNRSACSYPSRCQYVPICYGGEDIRRDPETHSDLYMPRTANHPIELTEPIS